MLTIKELAECIKSDFVIVMIEKNSNKSLMFNFPQLNTSTEATRLKNFCKNLRVKEVYDDCGICVEVKFDKDFWKFYPYYEF